MEPAGCLGSDPKRLTAAAQREGIGARLQTVAEGLRLSARGSGEGEPTSKQKTPA